MRIVKVLPVQCGVWGMGGWGLEVGGGVMAFTVGGRLLRFFLWEVGGVKVLSVDDEGRVKVLSVDDEGRVKVLSVGGEGS